MSPQPISPSTESRHGPCALTQVGVVSALGGSIEETWPRVVRGDQSHFTTRDDLVPGEQLLFGQVQAPLPEIPESLARYACRNNRLALGALESIRSAVEAAIEEFGAARVGIVAGSSTAGIAEAEGASREWAQTGRLSASFDLVQLEFGGLPEFLARASGARDSWAEQTAAAMPERITIRGTRRLNRFFIARSWAG